ncbi:MAG: hypothetical protein KBD62_37850 [Kofleriaceae bacterium]|nr:hypothetical protein [Kofleriaceae bacterium]
MKKLTEDQFTRVQDAIDAALCNGVPSAAREHRTQAAAIKDYESTEVAS